MEIPRLSRLEELERVDDSRPPFVLTYPEVKLLGIAGVSHERAFQHLFYSLTYVWSLLRSDSFSMVSISCGEQQFRLRN